MSNNLAVKLNLSKKEQVYLELKSDIITHRLRAGQPITEEEVVKEYSISRTPVREIFRKLEHDGLVNNIPYKGTYVADLKREDIEEILDIRFTLEGFAAKSAAEKMTEEGIKKLSELESQFQLASKDNNSVLSFEADSKLHELILDLAGNIRLRSIIINLMDQIHRIRFISGHIEGRIKTTAREHIEIVKALKMKDPILAEEKMQAHISSTKNLLLQSSRIEEQLKTLPSLIY
jgi:DNA-binding GntR family transcriptional regulator